MLNIAGSTKKKGRYILLARSIARALSNYTQQSKWLCKRMGHIDSLNKLSNCPQTTQGRTHSALISDIAHAQNKTRFESIDPNKTLFRPCLYCK
jgi:hypothetical protein